MYLHAFAGLGAITPEQYSQCQQQLLSLLAQLQVENANWQTLVATSPNPPASDQHNATVASLNAQIAAAQQCLAQPVAYPAPAPAPAPAPTPIYAPAPAPKPITPGGTTLTTALPLTPTAGAVQTGTGLPTEVDVATAGPAPLQLTDVQTVGAGAAPGKSNAGLLLLLLGGAAALMGGS